MGRRDSTIDHLIIGSSGSSGSSQCLPGKRPPSGGRPHLGDLLHFSLDHRVVPFHNRLGWGAMPRANPADPSPVKGPPGRFPQTGPPTPCPACGHRQRPYGPETSPVAPVGAIVHQMSEKCKPRPRVTLARPQPAFFIPSPRPTGRGRCRKSQCLTASGRTGPPVS